MHTTAPPKKNARRPDNASIPYVEKYHTLGRGLQKMYHGLAARELPYYTLYHWDRAVQLGSVAIRRPVLPHNGQKRPTQKISIHIPVHTGFQLGWGFTSIDSRQNVVVVFLFSVQNNTELKAPAPVGIPICRTYRFQNWVYMYILVAG